MNENLIEYKHYYSNGQLKNHYYRNSDGNKEGISLYYNDAGIMIMFVNFKNGIQNGITNFYADNGEIQYSGFLINGMNDGEFILH